MRKAFGMIELLFVLIIAVGIYFAGTHSKFGRNNPFEDTSRVNSQKQMVEDKLQEIENAKNLKIKIENNLKESN